MDFLSQPIAEAFSRALFHFLWEGTVIAAALAVGIYIIRPSSARVRYVLACLAMLAMVLAFVGTLAWAWPYSGSLAIQPAAAPHFRIPPPIRFTLPDTKPLAEPRRLNWIVFAWVLGAGILSLRSLIAWGAALRLKRSGVCAAPDEWRIKLGQLGERMRLSKAVVLLESSLTDVPVVVGFLRPAILVPMALFAGFPRDQLELILIHELAHIRRYDYLVNLLQNIVEDVLFYHPAVWWVSSITRAEREHCCDDIVVAETHNARGFAAALAALEQYRWSAQDAALAANGGHLMNRIRRLLEGRDRPRFAVAPAFFASLLPLAFAIAGSISQAQSVAAPPPLPNAPAPRPPAPVRIAQASPEPAPQATPKANPPADPQADARAAERALRLELETPYQKWLNQEVVYIISQQERQAFERLQTDEEIEMFIEQFWMRRDPTPSTQENEYREEFYRRIAYANESFGDRSGVPGWKTDRGMIYIKFGAPDEREQHPSGGFYERPIEAGGGQIPTFPFEKWRYRYIEGLGSNVTFEFVDSTQNGEYHLTTGPAEKGALPSVPKAEILDRFKQRPAQQTPNPFENVPQASPAAATPKPLVKPEDAVEAILFQGARRTSQDLLRNLIATHNGDKFDKEAVDRDLAALWDTKRFAEIHWTTERGNTGWIVTFTVAEIPV